MEKLSKFFKCDFVFWGSAIFLVLMGLTCAIVPELLTGKWDVLDFTFEARPPSNEHWFGVDEMGRDIFSRVLFGGRISLMVGIVTAITSTFIGVAFGSVAGYFGGAVDKAIVALIDLMYSVPSYFIILLVMVFFNVENIVVVFIVLALFQWLGMARIVRGQVLSLREREFVVATVACGASKTRVILKHLIPNCYGIIAVYATMTVPGVILQEAFLSFIGLSFQAKGSDGVFKPVASWGTLVSEGVRVFETSPWVLFFPALALSACLLALNFFGDGLRDRLDPNYRKS